MAFSLLVVIVVLLDPRPFRSLYDFVVRCSYAVLRRYQDDNQDELRSLVTSYSGRLFLVCSTGATLVRKRHWSLCIVICSCKIVTTYKTQRPYAVVHLFQRRHLSSHITVVVPNGTGYGIAHKGDWIQVRKLEAVLDRRAVLTHDVEQISNVRSTSYDEADEQDANTSAHAIPAIVDGEWMHSAYRARRGVFPMDRSSKKGRLFSLMQASYSI